MRHSSQAESSPTKIIIGIVLGLACLYFLFAQFGTRSSGSGIDGSANTTLTEEISDFDGGDEDFMGEPDDEGLKEDVLDKLVKDFRSTDPLVRDTEVEMTEKILNAAGDLLQRTRPYAHNLRAVNPFNLIGAYETLDIKYYNSAPGGHPLYTYPNMGLINNPNYCEYVDMFNLYHPENIFENMNFYTDYHPQGLVRNLVMTKMGTDTMPQVSKNMDRAEFYKKQYNLNHTIAIFHTKKVTFHYFHEIGKHFLCNSQMYSHLPGHGVLTRKDLQVESVNKYAKRFRNRPQCFNNKMFFPYAYRLDDKEECLMFFKEINTKEYEEIKKKETYGFIEKIGFGAHRGKGVFMFDEEREQNARTVYGDGELCGEIGDATVMQKYIASPLTLEGHKFDFRIYMLIASVNPMIIYYHDGFLRLSLQIYSKNSTDRSVHLTNTNEAKKIFQMAAQNGTAFGGMNETELRNYQMWNLEELQQELLDVKKITDKNWLNNYLRPQFQKAFIHLTRMVKNSLYKHSGLYEMFGLDFMLDDDLNLWFIECNASPQLIGTSAEKTAFLTRMLHDIFEIEFAYLRSRMKRVQKFMARFQKKLFEGSDFDLNALKEEFKKINKNYLEPEFTISPNSSFTRIMDLNLRGKDAFFGHIPDECIDDEDFDDE